MNKRTVIEVSADKQRCGQCGKIGTGFFKCHNDSTKYICDKCIMKNIDRKYANNKRG